MPNPTNNKLVDSKTIAALFDMTPRRVQQLTKDGVIAAVKEGNANRYDLLPTIQRYIRYLTAKANGREPSKKDSEIEGRRLEAEADLKRSKADIAALQLSELEGTMHRSEDVEAVRATATSKRVFTKARRNAGATAAPSVGSTARSCSTISTSTRRPRGSAGKSRGASRAASRGAARPAAA